MENQSPSTQRKPNLTPTTKHRFINLEPTPGPINNNTTNNNTPTRPIFQTITNKVHTNSTNSLDIIDEEDSFSSNITVSIKSDSSSSFSQSPTNITTTNANFNNDNEKDQHESNNPEPMDQSKPKSPNVIPAHLNPYVILDRMEVDNYLAKQRQHEEEDKDEHNESEVIIRSTIPVMSGNIDVYPGAAAEAMIRAKRKENKEFIEQAERNCELNGRVIIKDNAEKRRIVWNNLMNHFKY